MPHAEWWAALDRGVGAALIVGIVGAGAMGSALGARLRDGGARVVVALDGRSERSRRLANEAGLEDVGSLTALLRDSAIVLSVVPPEAAVEVATALAAEAAGAAPLVADLNAIAPSTAEHLASILGRCGARRRRRLDLGPAAACAPARRGSTSPARVRREVAAAPASRARARRRRRRRRAGLGGEDVHGVRLQGPRRAARAGAPAAARARRRSSPSSTISPRRSLSRSRATGRSLATASRQVRAVRRRDGGDRGDPGRCGADARPLRGARERLRRARRRRRGGAALPRSVAGRSSARRRAPASLSAGAEARDAAAAR